MAALTAGRMTIRLYCDEDSMGPVHLPTELVHPHFA